MPKTETPSSSTTLAAGGSRGSGFDEKAYEAERERKRQAVLAENKLRSAAAFDAVGKVTILSEAALRAILLEACHNHDQKDREALVPGLRKYIEKAPVTSVDFAKTVAVLSIAGLRVWEHQNADYDRPRLLESLKRLGCDASVHWKKPKAEKKSASAKKAVPAKKGTSPAKQRILSPAARARIAAAQKRRLAKRKVVAK